MVKDKKNRLIVIDGNALIHRSFHALPPTMATKKGEMVNAVYGFTTVLLKAIREFKPDYLALTLDMAGPTFRHQQYKEYKATRVKAPDELYKQIPRVKEVARAFNIPIYEKAGFEADDLIGTITKKVDSQLEKIILTGDLDTLQLVDDDTKVYTMSHGLSDSVTYDEKAVRGRFGLAPEQMIDYKALRGDPSDNIPGVRGIGEKTAIELLKHFKSLDGVYKNIESKKIKDRVRGLLKEHKRDAYLSKKLVTIKRDSPINFNLAEARFGMFNKEEVVKLFSELEFKSLLPRVHDLSTKLTYAKASVGKQEGSSASSPRPELGTKAGQAKRHEEIIDKFERNKREFKYYLVDDEKKFNLFFKKLKVQKSFTFDTEISSFDPITADLLGVSFSWKEGEAYYVEVRSKKLEVRRAENNLFNYKNRVGRGSASTKEAEPLLGNKWLQELKPIFENEKIKKYGHNMKFDIRVMKNNGVDVGGVEFDTMIASYLLNPGTRQHNLDALTFSELGFEKITKDELLGKGRDKIGFGEVDIEKLCLYSCEDADFTFRLVRKLSKQLRDQNLEKLFKDIEMPLAPVLARMEGNGIKIDTKYLEKIKKEVDKKIKNLERKIKKEAGVDFNINSTQQLREILFERLNIPTLEVGRTKTGLSTAASELEKLKDQHPIIHFIQEYRELNKLVTTYINALPELVNKKTGRLHTSFNQAVAATGRLSSSDPNLQNIPIRTELGREIRKAFIAEKGHKLLSFDYSQIELRLAAHMSGDKKMIKAFKEGVDIHTQTAAEINEVSLKDVTQAMRREAKAINFGILYGQGPHGLAETADIPYARAKEFIGRYFRTHKEIEKFINKTIEQARKDGYVKTLFGRRRYLPEINSSVMQVRKGAERMAINTPLQGTAADMIKIAMVEIAKSLTPPSLRSDASLLIRREGGGEDIRMLLQVHDELLFEIREDDIEKTVIKLKEIMENVIKLKVPIVVDVSMGENWGSLEKLEV